MPLRRYTLLSDGSSDRVLLPILEWMLFSQHPGFEWIGQHAELGQLQTPPRSLEQRIAAACEFFPSDLLFVHRDSEGDPPEQRFAEIEDAVEKVTAAGSLRWTPVIPVRMTEAWLLISEDAIRGAAGNPNGRARLQIPPLSKLEELPDPKKLLETLLVEASELSGRRRKKFLFARHRARVPDFIHDWSPLLTLCSAKALHDHLGALELP